MMRVMQGIRWVHILRDLTMMSMQGGEEIGRLRTMRAAVMMSLLLSNPEGFI